MTELKSFRQIQLELMLDNLGDGDFYIVRDGTQCDTSEVMAESAVLTDFSVVYRNADRDPEPLIEVIEGEKGEKGEIGETGLAGDRGLMGITGPRGPMGPTGGFGPEGKVGERGPIGNTGQVGKAGPPGGKGEYGQHGLIGPIGPMGVTGVQGEVGEKGEKGNQGIRGVHGKPGPLGDQGFKGDIGSQGEPGEIGSRGRTGPPGPPGIDGELGEKGHPGKPGPKGHNGKQGDDGLKGLEGKRGSRGAKGDIGPEGPEGKRGSKGTNGEEGPQGRRGNTGKVGPSPEVETKSNAFRIKKPNGAWGEWTYIKAQGGGGDYVGGGIGQMEARAIAQQVINDATIGNSGHIIEDEGNALPEQPSLNFVGDGVSVTNDSTNNATLVTITSGGASSIPDEKDYDITIDNTTQVPITSIEAAGLSAVYLNGQRLREDVNKDYIINNNTIEFQNGWKLYIQDVITILYFT